jgi:ribosomal protein S13
MEKKSLSFFLLNNIYLKLIIPNKGKKKTILCNNNRSFLKMTPLVSHWSINTKTYITDCDPIVGRFKENYNQLVLKKPLKLNYENQKTRQRQPSGEKIKKQCTQPSEGKGGIKKNSPLTFRGRSPIVKKSTLFIDDSIKLKQFNKISAYKKKEILNLIKKPLVYKMSQGNLLNRKCKKLSQFYNLTKYQIIKNRRGFRHEKGLPANGQRTRSNRNTCKIMKRKIASLQKYINGLT